MRPVICFLFISFTSIFAQSQGIITGTVKDSLTQLPLSNSNISIEEIASGTVTDQSGGFYLNMPYGSYTLKISYVGYKTFVKEIELSGDNKNIDLNVLLSPASFNTDEVMITGKQEESSTISQQIEQKDLEKMPLIYDDYLRAVQILPGVSSNSELSSGYNVRGGNFDDNLIYLNGFEIYRPFLLRQGVEENKTLINPDLVNEFRFYNGSFPAVYGDKMSSALEVNYSLQDTEGISSIFKVDLLSTGLTVKNKSGDFKYAAAVRYAFPGLFLNALQTNGEYKPHFYDIQVIASYPFNDKSSIETFILYADNKFDLTPTNWSGSFGGYFRGDYRGMDIIYSGERKYGFKTGLAGLKYNLQLNDNLNFKLSAAMYSTDEEESSNLNSEYYYFVNAENREDGEHVKSGLEDVDNDLSLTSYEIIPRLQWKLNEHLFTAGINMRLTDVTNGVSEFFYESNDSLVSDFPLDRKLNEQFKLNSYSLFLQDDFSIDNRLLVDAGVRATYYEYSDELLISPRVNLNYIISSQHNVTLSAGYYFQPPYYAELRNKQDVNATKLKSQKSIHLSTGWEYRFKKNLKFNVEAYYKILDDLIPYYIDREKTEYTNANSKQGYAYGIDLMVQGEIVEGMNSWLGYGYLNTQEKYKPGFGDGGAKYVRRLTDQTHTLQVFLQDRIKKHPNWQSHFRMLFGSGYLYNLRETVTDPVSQQQYLQVSTDRLEEYSMYFRVDMGLSASFDIGGYKLIAVAEVLNLFNHRNFGAYRFVQVSNEDKTFFFVPQILSSRFLNVGIELRL